MAATVNRLKSAKNQTQPLLGSSRRGGVLGLLGVAGFLGVWWLIAASGAVSSLIVPSPLRVIGSISDIGWQLPLHFAATFTRVVVGFVLGSVGGMAIGVAMQFSR